MSLEDELADTLDAFIEAWSPQSNREAFRNDTRTLAREAAKQAWDEGNDAANMRSEDRSYNPYRKDSE